MKSGKWAKIARSIAGLTLAAGFVALTAGCQGYDIYIVPKDPDASQTEPNKDLTEPEQKDPETPTTPTQPSKPDYSMYSDILRTVLESDYYNDLIFRIKNDNKNFIQSIVGRSDNNINLMEPIPYRFLKEAGEDVKAIKNNDIICRTACFNYESNPNELYVITNVINGNDDEAITTQYLLKYQLTDKELEEYTSFHGWNYHYYQEYFFIQELDNQKDATLVSKFKLSANVLGELSDGLNNQWSKVYSYFDKQDIGWLMPKKVEQDEKGKYHLTLDVIGTSSKESEIKTDRMASVTIEFLSRANISYFDNVLIIENPDQFIYGTMSEFSDVKLFNTIPSLGNFRSYIKSY